MPLEITLAIADLIEALKNNNLEETIKLTNYLNNNINFINEELN